MDRCSSATSTAIVARVDEIKGKAGEALRAHLAERHAQPPAQRARRRPGAAASPPTSSRWRGWDREAVAPGLRRPGVPGAARPALSRISTPSSRRPRAGFDLAGSGPARRASARWLAEHAPAGTRVGVAVAGTLGRGTGDAHRHRAGRRRRRRPPGSTRPSSTPTTTRRWPAWLADRGPAQGAARRQGPDAGVRRPRLALDGRRQRHRARGLPRPARPALLRPRRPGPALPQARAARRGPPDDGQLSARRPGRRRRRGRGRAACCAPARCSTSPTALDEELRRRGGRPGCSPTSSCRWSTVLAAMERTGIAVDTDYLRELESQFAGEVKAAAQEAYEVIGQEINLGSPKQLQVVLFDELGMPKTKRTKTGYTTDADALQGLLRADRAPVPRAPAAPPRRRPGCGRPSRACSSRSPTTAASTPPSTRRSPRPAGCLDRPQPAEHPDPHRGGPADPRGLRGRRGLSSR